MKENVLTVKEARNRRYPTETIMDADDTDDTALLTNTPAEAECLLYHLEQAEKDIDLYLNSSKTEFISLNKMVPN